jgi:hypothetical protein
VLLTVLSTSMYSITLDSTRSRFAGGRLLSPKHYDAVHNRFYCYEKVCQLTVFNTR